MDASQEPQQKYLVLLTNERERNEAEPSRLSRLKRPQHVSDFWCFRQPNWKKKWKKCHERDLNAEPEVQSMPFYTDFMYPTNFILILSKFYVYRFFRGCGG